MKKIVLLFFLLYLNTFFAQFNYQRDWATYYGGENTFLTDQAIDSQGNIYIVGSVSGSIPYSNSYVTVNAHQDYYGGGISDGFLAKYDPNGNLLWSTYYGGDDTDYINSISIENDNIYIAGSTNSTANIATPNSFSPNLPQDGNAGFIAKFSTEGVRDWGSYYVAETDIFGIKSYNNTIIIYGFTTNATDIATPNAFQSTLTTAFSPFITKFNRNGQREWSTYYYAPNNQQGFITSSCINSSGIFVNGFTPDNSGFYGTSGSYQPQSNGEFDSFLTKFDFNGERLWSTYFGGSGSEFSTSTNQNGLVCNEDAVYLTNSTTSLDHISTPETFQEIYTSNPQYLVKFNNAGERLWGTYFGGGSSVTTSEECKINLDNLGNPYVSGVINSLSNSISTENSYQELPAGSLDAFVLKFSPSGQRLWGTYYGGENTESDGNIAVYNDNFYICGTTSSQTGIATINSQQSLLNVIPNNDINDNNAFIAKFYPIPLSANSNYLENITLFPNPNTGNFTLQGNFTGDLAITIHDNQGRSVFSQETVSFQGKNTVAIASKLSSGIYFIKVFNDNVTKTYKMIVK